MYFIKFNSQPNYQNKRSEINKFLLAMQLPLKQMCEIATYVITEFLSNKLNYIFVCDIDKPKQSNSVFKPTIESFGHFQQPRLTLGSTVKQLASIERALMLTVIQCFSKAV